MDRPMDKDGQHNPDPGVPMRPWRSVDSEDERNRVRMEEERVQSLQEGEAAPQLPPPVQPGRLRQLPPPRPRAPTAVLSGTLSSGHFDSNSH